MLEKIKEIIAEQIGIDKDHMDESDMLADLGADSLDVIEIAMWLEDEFDIEISEDDMSIDMTVAEVAEPV